MKKTLTALLICLGFSQSVFALQTKTGVLYSPTKSRACKGLVLRELPPPTSDLYFFNKTEYCIDPEGLSADKLNEGHFGVGINEVVALTGFFSNGSFDVVGEPKKVDCPGDCSACSNPGNPLYECVQFKDSEHGCQKQCYRHPW